MYRVHSADSHKFKSCKDNIHCYLKPLAGDDNILWMIIIEQTYSTESSKWLHCLFFSVFETWTLTNGWSNKCCDKIITGMWVREMDTHGTLVVLKGKGTFTLIEIKLKPRQAFDTDLGISVGEKEWLHHGCQCLDGVQAELTSHIFLRGKHVHSSVLH